MKKYKTQIIALSVGAVLAIAALVINYAPSIKLPTKTEHVFEVASIAKDSALVNNGDYVYFTNTDGDIMRIHAFETEAELYINNRSIMAMNDTHFLVKNNDTLEMFNKEEKGIDESYNIKCDNAAFTDDTIYYVHPETKYLMTRDRASGEESVLLSYAIKKLMIKDNTLYYVPVGKKTGIIVYSLEQGWVNLYLQDITLTDFALYEDLILYSDGDDGNKVKYLNLNSGATHVTDKIKSEKISFSKGVYFYIKEGKKADMLMLDNYNAYR